MRGLGWLLLHALLASAGLPRASAEQGLHGSGVLEWTQGADGGLHGKKKLMAHGNKKVLDPAIATALVGILSYKNGGFDKREMLRKTYLSHARRAVNAHFFFYIGLESGVKPEVLEPLLKENATYHDLVLLNNVTDVNHSNKTHRFWEWVAPRAHKYDFIAKTDDDTYIHVYNFQRMLNSLPKKQLYWGKANINVNFAYISFNVMKFSSVYCAGGLYVVSSELVHWFGSRPEVMAKTIGMWIEDWNTGWLVALAKEDLYGRGIPLNSTYLNDTQVRTLSASDVIHANTTY